MRSDLVRYVHPGTLAPVPDKPKEVPRMTASAILTLRGKLLEPVEEAAAQVEATRLAYQEALDRFQTQIVDAVVDGGVSVADICRASGLSRGRIYQIIDKVNAKNNE